MGYEKASSERLETMWIDAARKHLKRSFPDNRKDDAAEQRERRELRRWAIEQAIAVGASSSTLEMVADMIVNYVREDEGGTTNV